MEAKHSGILFGSFFPVTVAKEPARRLVIFLVEIPRREKLWLFFFLGT
jgi:hypothetical protein